MEQADKKVMSLREIGRTLSVEFTRSSKTMQKVCDDLRSKLTALQRTFTSRDEVKDAFPVVAVNELKAGMIDHWVSIQREKKVVATALLMNVHEVGKLKLDNPEKHALVAAIRKQSSVYASQGMGRLYAAFVTQSENSGTKAPNKDMAAVLAATLDALTRKMRLAKERGDVSASPEAVAKVIAAIKAALK
jgi:hypothetical protein